ncbi:MAG: LysM peptidoglycan-binding domain-containing protein [Anaerolineales bacterium]|nr:LysM peptidoglycan-binding domain-containing protein [Anaerolineales bacterium]
MKKALFSFTLLLALATAPIAAHAAPANLPSQADLPSQAYISGFVGRAQQYSLSCESRSAVDVAAFWGYAITETEFFTNLPSSDDPNLGFVGNVNDAWGYIPPNSYGVHAEPIARLLRSYGLNANAAEGLSWGDLQNEIAAGRPVIVWVIGSVWAGTPRTYTTQAGLSVRVAHNQHTMTLIGYDENSVQLVDALTGYTITHSIQNFLASWGVLNNMAVFTDGPRYLAEPSEPQSEPAEEAGAPGYSVQSGDTLQRVAARLGLAWEDLAAWNNIAYPYALFPGQTLRVEAPPQANPVVPSAGTYTVQRGDHLMKIARELALDWQALAAINEMESPYLLLPGQVLQLPAADGQASPQVSSPPPVAIEVPEYYTAGRTESLFALAHYYGLDWLQVAVRNNLNFPYTLTPGQTVYFQ